MENRLCFVMLLWITAVCVSGCKFVKIKEQEKTPVKYEIVSEEKIPEEISTLIERKKEKEFQMIYQSKDDMYLLKGYGQQTTGGYGIQVLELGMTEEALFLKTRLLAPGETDPVKEPSCPYIIIKTKYQELPVIFQ